MPSTSDNSNDSSGRGSDYEPYLKTHQVPSKGLSTRIMGWKTNRVHHLLSKLELFYFYNLEWFSSIIDIREQYPLDLKNTIDIANNLKVRHPGYTKGTTYVMTTDFVITIKKDVGIGELARTVKYSQDLSNPRSFEKFEIERIYWNSRGIDWGIVTEKEIDVTLAKNVEWIHPYLDIKLCPPLTQNIIAKVLPLLAKHIVNKNATLSDLAIALDVQLGLKTGICLTAFRHLIATGKLKANMHSHIEPSKKLSELGLTISK